MGRLADRLTAMGPACACTFFPMRWIFGADKIDKQKNVRKVKFILIVRIAHVTLSWFRLWSGFDCGKAQTCHVTFDLNAAFLSETRPALKTVGSDSCPRWIWFLGSIIWGEASFAELKKEISDPRTAMPNEDIARWWIHLSRSLSLRSSASWLMLFLIILLKIRFIISFCEISWAVHSRSTPRL